MNSTVTATRRAADTLLILLALLLAWQALYGIVGATALPAPAATLAYLARFVPSARFVENAGATLATFAAALAVSYAAGLAIGV